MGCRSTVVVEGVEGERLAELAMIRIARLEAGWSAFLPDSDVSRINRAGGAAVAVRSATVTLLRAMAEATTMTAGACDPTVVTPIVGLGGFGGFGPQAAARPSCADDVRWIDAVAVDVAASVVQVAAGIRLDAGGIGKGLAADLVAADTIADGAAAVAVMIGGDGRVRSTDPGRPWAIEIAAPGGVGSVDRIATSDAAIATSGFHRAHLVDPATGALCQPGDIVQASVLAGTGASAEALTKAVLVGSDKDISDRLDRYDVGVLAVHAGGGVSANTTWRRHRTGSGATAA
jgi:thiamine biosynthesis lipoprotein